MCGYSSETPAEVRDLTYEDGTAAEKTSRPLSDWSEETFTILLRSPYPALTHRRRPHQQVLPPPTYLRRLLKGVYHDFLVMEHPREVGTLSRCGPVAATGACCSAFPVGKAALSALILYPTRYRSAFACSLTPSPLSHGRLLRDAFPGGITSRENNGVPLFIFFTAAGVRWRLSAGGTSSAPEER
jgi:hypothetical protein